MRDYKIVPEGWHELSGFCDTTTKPEEYSDEEVNALIVRIDGMDYICFEDPSDGYRSHSEIMPSEQECTNTFPPQRVYVKYYERHDDVGMEIYNPDFGLILLIGTDYADDYYPVARWEWHPENLPINHGFHKPEYMMPGDLTMKVVKEVITNDGATTDTILDTVDEYYRKAYRKGGEDFAKAIKDAIGDLDDFGHCYSRVGDYVSALERVVKKIGEVYPKYQIKEED